jgi:YesN/AraC family two-component response regulator
MGVDEMHNGFAQVDTMHTDSDTEFSAMNVLIVDDDKASREGLRELIELRPDIHVIGEAIDGNEAINLANTLHPDLVLMDVQMPNMDGLEATRQIKLLLPNIRVILLTMYREYRAAAERSGADAFLIKGEGIGALLKALAG